MKTLYKCCVFLLALGCWNVSLAGSSDPPPPPPNVNITISGAVSSSSVCPGDAFTARANVSNASTSGLVYEWAIAIGTVNGQNLLTTTSNTITGIANRAFSGNRSDIRVRVLRNGSEIADDTKAITLLPNTTPAQPGFISITPDNPNSPTNSVICQNSGATFSVSAVSGAVQYQWTANGRTTTTRSASFTTFFNSVGSQTISVRAIGCAGTSAARATSIVVITASQSPCDNGQFLRTTPVSAKSKVSTYPNPVDNGNLQIDVSDDYPLSNAQLVDQKTGRSMKSFTIKDSQSVVTTDDLPKGTYLLKVQNQEGTLTRRIVVE